MNEEQLKKARETGGEVVHIPLVMGAVVPTYNLRGSQRAAPVLRERCWPTSTSGKIKKWNDPELARLNPGGRIA